MKAKIVYVAAALVLVFSLAAAIMLATPVTAHPGTIYVDVNDGGCVAGSGQPDPYAVVYCSIQDAIDDATHGDTIIVAAGQYNEHDITIDKDLIIQGAGAGSTVESPVTSNAVNAIWGTDVCVYSGSLNQFTPSMATASNGDLYVAYESIFDHWGGPKGIRVSRSTDGGESWTLFYSFHDPSIDYSNPSIAIDPYDDRIYIAYEREWTASDYDIHCQVYDPSTGWHNYTIDSDYGKDRYPSITCEYNYLGTSYVYVSYEHIHTSDDRDLMFAKSTDHGQTWAVKKLRGGSDHNVNCETSITYADYVIYIAFRHSADYAPGAGESEIWVVRSTDWGSSWQLVKVIDNTPKPCRYPSIAATHGGDRVMVAWESERSSTNDDVRYAYSTNNGATWSNSVNYGYCLSCSSSDNEKAPALTVDGGGSTSNTVNGYFHAVYWNERDIKYEKAYYSTPLNWSSPVKVNNANHASPDFSTTITTQKRGVSYYPCVAWTDYRPGSAGYDIYSATVCGDMGVSPTTWSPTMGSGVSWSRTVTVSASSGAVKGVTMLKVTGPAWLTVSTSGLGTIAYGTSKTFQMTAAPPTGTSGSFTYTVRVSNTCGTPAARDVTGTITVVCGDMGVYPTTWSPTMGSGQSWSKTVTVSASSGAVLGVTVSKIDGPDWLTLSPSTPFSLGTILPGASETFKMTAAPPAGSIGSFTYTVEVSNTCGTPSSRDVTGTITVNCGDMLISPTTWSPTIGSGQSSLKNVLVVAIDGAIKDVTVSRLIGPAWLTVSPSSLGTIAPGTSKTFTMTAAPPTGTSGSFTYTVEVYNTCGTPSSKDVTGMITVNYIADPTICRSPSSFSFTATECGSNPLNQYLSIWNCGAGDLNWDVSDNAGWLTLSPTAGSSTGETDTVTLSVDKSGMSAGSYPATLTISAGGATNTPQTVPVGLHIYECGPTICHSPSSFSFNANEGGASPTSQTLSIWNCGEDTLNWQVSDDAGWLTLSPTAGGSTGETDTVTLSVDISGMWAGSYPATLTISAAGATNTPRTIPVSLIIDPITDPTTLTHTWTFYTAGFFPKHLPDAYNGQVVLAGLDLADIPDEVQGVWWYDPAILAYRFWVPGVGGDLMTLTGQFYNYKVLVTGACEWEIPLP